VFAPLPADGRVDVRADSTAAGTYVFTGGGTGRDFASVIEAVRGTGLELEIVTFSPATLGWDGELPANCRVRWRMPVDAFVDRIARALFVVVPLRDAESDFGQTTVVQALSAGKAVVATRSLGIVDYVEDGREGFLVEAGDVGAYRAAILRLARDPKLRSACELNARRRAELLTYAEFGVRLRSLCEELLRVDHDAA
jgi:glycosyltransferase involved in cell wall biosynthesis